MSESDNKYSGESGRLLFVPIGRELVDPLDMDGAISLAILGIASPDIRLEWNEQTGESRMPQFPPQADATARGRRFASGYMAILTSLAEQRLVAFASDGSKTYRIDRMYWRRDHGLSQRGCLVEGVGVPQHLVGAQILIDHADIDAWREVAGSATSVLTSKRNTEVLSPSSAPKPSRGPRATTAPQRRLSKFLLFADEQGRDNLVHDRLWDEYCLWNSRKNKEGLTKSNSLKISAFKKWRKRWRGGERW